jgi:hypothetical protein
MYKWELHWFDLASLSVNHVFPNISQVEGFSGKETNLI